MTVIGPAEPVLVGQPVNVVGHFADRGVLDTWTYQWEWGDGSVRNSSTSSQGVLPPASHTYAEPGVYLVRLVVADDDSRDGSDYLLVSVVAEEVPQVQLYDVAVDRAAGASVVNFVSNGRVVTRRPTFPTPHEYDLPGYRPSTDVGLEVLTDPVTLAGVPVAAGMLLVTNGAVSPDAIYAVHPTTGQVLVTLPLDDDYESVGGTYHAASDSLFVFSSALNRMVRIDPATGHTVRWTDPQTGASEVGMTSPFAAATAITHGDVTVHPLSGNLVVGADVSTVIYEVDMDGHVVRSLDLATYGLLEAGVTGLAFTHDNQLMLTRSIPGTDTTIVDAGPLFAAKALAARRWSSAGMRPFSSLEPNLRGTWSRRVRERIGEMRGSSRCKTADSRSSTGTIRSSAGTLAAP